MQRKITLRNKLNGSTPWDDEPEDEEYVEDDGSDSDEQETQELLTWLVKDISYTERLAILSELQKREKNLQSSNTVTCPLEEGAD